MRFDDKFLNQIVFDIKKTQITIKMMTKKNSNKNKNNRDKTNKKKEKKAYKFFV